MSALIITHVLRFCNANPPSRRSWLLALNLVLNDGFFMQTAAKVVKDRFGAIDYLINNACMFPLCRCLPCNFQFSQNHQQTVSSAA